MSSTAPPGTKATLGCPHCGRIVSLSARAAGPKVAVAPAPAKRMPPSPVDPNAVKRGPGRPRKVPPPQPPTPMPPVAKRGRPPKVAAAPKPANGNGDAAVSTPTVGTPRVAMAYSLTKGVDPDAIKAPQRKAVAYAIQGAGEVTTAQLASRLTGSPLFPRQDKLKADISAIVSGLKREGLVTSRVA